MASLPYMQFYVADYLADTAHLDTIQHGAYMLLIMNYWQTGKPLPDNDKKLAAICKMSLREWKKHRTILQEFFKVEFGTWTHKRIEKDLATVHEKSELARVAGKKSGERRRNGRSTNVHTDVANPLNHKDKDIDKDTDIDTELSSENVALKNTNNVLLNSRDNTASGDIVDNRKPDSPSVQTDPDAEGYADDVDNSAEEMATDSMTFVDTYPRRYKIADAMTEYERLVAAGESPLSLMRATLGYARHVEKKGIAVADIPPADVWLREGLWKVYLPHSQLAAKAGADDG